MPTRFTLALLTACLVAIGGCRDDEDRMPRGQVETCGADERYASGTGCVPNGKSDTKRSCAFERGRPAEADKLQTTGGADCEDVEIVFPPSITARGKGASTVSYPLHGWSCNVVSRKQSERYTCENGRKRITFDWQPPKK